MLQLEQRDPAGKRNTISCSREKGARIDSGEDNFDG